MKKLFQCGHKGRGQYCHRCEQAAELKKDAKLHEEKKDIVKAGELYAKAQKLLAVPKKESNNLVPSEPVPA